MAKWLRKVKIHNSFHDTTAIVALWGDYHDEYIKKDAYLRARRTLCQDKDCDCHIHDSLWNGVNPGDRLYLIAAVAKTMVREGDEK